MCVCVFTLLCHWILIFLSAPVISSEAHCSLLALTCLVSVQCYFPLVKALLFPVSLQPHASETVTTGTEVSTDLPLLYRLCYSTAK